MKKLRYIVLVLVSVAVATGADGQNQSFQEYRQQLLNGYNQFRQSLLDNYADFLNSEWQKYQALSGERRYRSPKPERAPAVADSDISNTSEMPERVTPFLPRNDNRTEPRSNPAMDENDGSIIDFFEIPVPVPRIDFNILERLESNADYASQWKMMADGHVASRVVPTLKKIATDMGLNDYLTFQLVKAYVDSTFPDKDDSSRFSAIHYLLANMGYDARIAITDSGTPLLLLPFDRTIYSRPYMMLEEKKYYLFTPDLFDVGTLGSKTVYTCKIPAAINKGNSFGLVLGELKIPYEPYKFELKGGRITISGELNRNLMPILYHYPQMGVDGFAQSNIQPRLREDLVRQIRSQLEDMNERDAVNAFLEFTHKAFDYASDQTFHGFEKPYFLEESLFYPKNDCEDRAIFFTYFIWNALGNETQLISFPEHESASVCFDMPIEGNGYKYEGKTFFFSDPTYIGSTTGMIMPRYQNEKPTIDYTYKKER